jgi:hypothetical protein
MLPGIDHERPEIIERNRVGQRYVVCLATVELIPFRVLGKKSVD